MLFTHPKVQISATLSPCSQLALVLTTGGLGDTPTVLAVVLYRSVVAGCCRGLFALQRSVKARVAPVVDTRRNCTEKIYKMGGAAMSSHQPLFPLQSGVIHELWSTDGSSHQQSPVG